MAPKKRKQTTTLPPPPPPSSTSSSTTATTFSDNEEGIIAQLTKLAIASSYSSVPTYNSQVPSKQQKQLVGQQSNKKKEVKKQKRDVVSEFDTYFGELTRLENWQQFCRDLGIKGEFSSITQCKKALEPVWVNIYDFLDARAKNMVPLRWKSERALASYTRETKKFYPLKKAKEGGPVRALLAHVRRHAY